MPQTLGFLDSLVKQQSTPLKVLPSNTEDRPRRSSRSNFGKPPDKEFFKASNKTAIAEPTTWKQMLKSDEVERWKSAIQEEFKSLIEMKTWDLVDRPSDKPVVKNKWIFKIKKNSDGSIERFKARLVAKGFTQTHGIDYTETFSPVVRFETLRYLFATAVQNDHEIHNMDVKTAFLNGNLEEQIFMEQPEGFTTDKSKVCLLKKSLYGLKQSPRCWNQRFSEFIKKNGFIQSNADPCLFISNNQKEIQMLAIYVDDCFLIGSSANISEMKSMLSKEFKMHDLGKTKYALGIDISQSSGGIRISQEHYINEMLSEFGFSDCKGIDTPIIQPKLQIKSEKLDSQIPYMEAVGSLNYLATCTRPDISYAVNRASRSMQAPTSEDWVNIKRIFRYLKKNKRFWDYLQKGRTKQFSSWIFRRLLCTRSNRPEIYIWICLYYEWRCYFMEIQTSTNNFSIINGS
jgi:hypothetical protein